MITAGIDIGTAAIKVVFIKNRQLLWAQSQSTAPRQRDICESLLKDGLSSLSLRKEDLGGIAATGYGKDLFTGTEKKINEISANAIGAYVLSNMKARTVINIGGQDMKIIRLDSDGKVIDFKMNNKCAAGTGRFFEMAERILNLPVQKFGDLGASSNSPVCINSTCCVFAESELVSLLSLGKAGNDIIAGIHKSVARKISDLAGNIHLEDEIYLDGGPGTNTGLLAAVKEEFMRGINVFPRPQFTAAYGAALSLAIKKEV